MTAARPANGVGGKLLHTELWTIAASMLHVHYVFAARARMGGVDKRQKCTGSPPVNRNRKVEFLGRARVDF